jgi:excisionase family DNA binding protein
VDLEPLTIRVAEAVQITGFSDHEIRKLIKTGELKSVRVGRAILIDYSHFKAFCIQHRKSELASQKVVNLHWPNPGRRTIG